MSNALTFEWAPLVPWPVLTAFAVLAAVAVGVALWRRARGTWWRALTAAGLLLALADPSLVEEQRQIFDDVAFVLVDESPSQGIAPREEQSAAALDYAVRALGGLPNTEVRVVRAGADALTAATDGTHLFAALREAMGKVPRQRIAGVIIISDGQIHDVPESIEALGLTAPLHLLLSGGENEGDRRLTIGRAPGFGIVGRPLSFTLTVDDIPPAPEPRTARLTVRRDGQATRVLRVPVGVEQTVEFHLDHRGPNVLDIEVEAGPREMSLANNRAAVEINGVRDRLRVLLVSGEPHAGERAWRNILKSDPSVDLVHFTILRPPEKQDGTPIRELSLIAFPTRELFEVKLDEFDLIIFDRYRRRGVLPTIYLDNIATYVENGGALFEAVGPTFATPLSLYRTPLGRVLPGEPTGAVFERGFHPRVTALGERHPVTAALDGGRADGGEPAWGRWLRQIDADPRGGAVVMNGVNDRPLLILDRVGEGRVAQLLSDHMWLWSRGFEGGGPQAELLRRVAHWLMREPDLEEENLRASVNGGALEITRRSLSAEQPPIEIVAPSGAKQQVTLEPGTGGRASTALPVDEIGLYRVSDGQRSALAAAGPLNPLEFHDLRASAEPLAHLLQANGGAFFSLLGGNLPDVRKVKPHRDRHGRDWLGVLENNSYVVTGVSQVPFPPPLVLLLLILSAGLIAWYREGH